VRRNILDMEILPIIDTIAAETGSFMIDYRNEFASHPDYFPDKMHFNDTGTLAIGRFFANNVTTALVASAADGGAMGDGGTADIAAPAMTDAAVDPTPSPPGPGGGGSGGSAGTPAPPNGGSGPPKIGCGSGGGCHLGGQGGRGPEAAQRVEGVGRRGLTCRSRRSLCRARVLRALPSCSALRRR
jgi:hypothetical protein